MLPSNFVLSFQRACLVLPVLLLPSFGQSPNSNQAASADYRIPFNQGLEQFKAKRFAEAADSFKQAVKLNPMIPQAHYNLCISYLNTARPDDAIKACEEAVRLKRDYFEAFMQMGAGQRKAGHAAAAIAAFEQAQKLRPNDPAPAYAIGLTHYVEKQYDEAIRHFQAVLKLQFDHYDAYVKMGNALDFTGKFQEALTAYRKAAQLRPTEAEPWKEMGVVFYQREKYAEAAEVFKEAFRRAPDDFAVTVNLGNALDHIGKYDEAVAAYHVATKLNPTDAWPWAELGIAHLHQHKYSEALTAFRKSLSLRPDYEKAQMGLADVYYLLGEYAQALVVYQDVVQRSPQNATAHKLVGDSFAKLKRSAEAMAAYQKAIEVKPDYAEAYLMRGNLHYNARRFAQALPDYQAAAKHHPQWALVHFYLGDTLYALKRYREAETAYQETLRLEHKHHAARSQLALMYWRQGKQALALTEQKTLAEQDVEKGAELLAIITTPTPRAKSGVKKTRR